jgi:hypothetical protein
MIRRIECGDEPTTISIYVTSISQPTVLSSATDQEGDGREVGLPFGAVRIRVRSAGRYGHVSRRGLHRDSIGKLLKRAAGRAGLKVEELGGHSLRAGRVTQAAMNGVREFVIMKQRVTRRLRRCGAISGRAKSFARTRRRASESKDAASAREFSLPGLWRIYSIAPLDSGGTMRLRPSQRHPIHRHLFCWRREVISNVRRARQTGVRRIDDPFTRAVITRSAQMRKLMDRKIATQNSEFTICKEKFTDYSDIVPDHINPRGIGGTWRD